MAMVMRIFDNLPAAENARKALLGAGFSGDSVQLTSRDDEAGPVQGNFVVDRKDAGKDKVGGFVTPPPSDVEHRDTLAPQQAVLRGTLILTVEAQDDHEAGRATDIIDRCMGGDSDQRV